MIEFYLICFAVSAIVIAIIERDRILDWVTDWLVDKFWYDDDNKH
jgi:hypothetical protein